MPKKNSKREMVRLIKVLNRNHALKQAAKKSYARPESAPAPAGAENNAAPAMENAAAEHEAASSQPQNEGAEE